MAPRDETEAPPPPPPPPITTSFDLWDPFGEPGELRAAADAWEDAAEHLEQVRSRLGTAVLASASGWSGRAAHAFSSHWDTMAPEVAEGAAGMREVAAQLRAMADELEAKNDLVQSIYVMVAATAGVSVLAGLVSFGAGFVAGAAATAAHVMRAERVLAAVKALLVASRVAMAAVRASRVARFALRFAAFSAQGAVGTAAVKGVALDQDPFDLDNWSGADALGVAAGGFTSASLALRGAALAGTRGRAFASGFAGDAVTTAAVDAVGGNATAGQVVTNALLSATLGGVPLAAGRSRSSPLWGHWSRDNRYIPPSDADWAPVPRTLQPQSEPAEFSRWVNAGGNGVPGRDVNCADCARAVEVSWRGTRQVSAARAPGAGGESRAEIEAWLGRPLEPQTFTSIGTELGSRGHGSSAYVVVYWKGAGGHAFNAVNHKGTVYFVDAQPTGGAVDVWPPKAGSPGYGFAEGDVQSTFATFFDADGAQ